VNRDQLNNADPLATARSAFRVLDRLQELEPHLQPMALAWVFVLYCESKDIRPSELMNTVDNIMRDQEDIGWRSHFRAVKRYIKEELA